MVELFPEMSGSAESTVRVDFARQEPLLALTGYLEGARGALFILTPPCILN